MGHKPQHICHAISSHDDLFSYPEEVSNLMRNPEKGHPRAPFEGFLEVELEGGAHAAQRSDKVFTSLERFILHYAASL